MAALREAIVLKIASAGRWPTFIVSGSSIRRALSGDILKVVYGATFRFDKTALIDELHAMASASIRSGSRQTAGTSSADPDHRLPDRRRGGKVVRAIEENGGWVVGYENCTGAKATERCVAEEGDVYDALTDKYLAIGCSVSPQRPASVAAEPDGGGVSGRRGDRRHLQACHTYGGIAGD